MNNEPFDDGFDWIIKDKTTGEQLALFHYQNEVLPFAYRVGRDTVTIQKVKREGKKEMSEQRIVNLSEMMLKVVSEEVLLPKTGNPDKEAEDLTKDTGLYHYADHDDMIGKPVIINTNVEATNEGEWMEKAYNSPVNEESPVIEPSNFNKNDEYEVTDSDQVAEGYDRDKWEAGYEAFEAGSACPSDPSEKDGWMEAQKEHRKAGQMDEDDSDVKDWREVAIGIYKHNFLPLAYDDNSGQVTLYDIEGASNLGDAEYVGTFNSVPEMKEWITANLKDGVAEQYQNVGETDDNSEEIEDMATDEATDKLDEAGPINSIGTNDLGVNNNDGDNYGPAPTEDQNDMEFDKDGKFVIEDEIDSNLIAKAKQARDDSKNGYVQHVDDRGNGQYSVSDWMSDDTVVSYSNGHCLNGNDPLEGIADDSTEDYSADGDVDSDINLGEAKFKPSANSFDSYVDLPHADDVEVTVNYDIHEDDPSVGYHGGVEITSVIEKSTGKELIDSITADTESRLSQQAEEDASGQEDDYGDYKYDQMRDERMEREFDEGKDHRFDPDADDSDYDRQDRMNQRKQDKKDRRKDIDEDSGNLERVFLLAVDFTHDRLELLHKGMSDVDSAIALIADGRPKDSFYNELNMGGLPMTAELDRDNNHTLVALDKTLVGAIKSLYTMDSCQELLAGLDISQESFMGFLGQGKTGAEMDLTGELTEDEDEMFEAPDFVVSTENLHSNELAEDPMFITVMNDAFISAADKAGQKVEEFNPSIDEVDDVIDMGIDSYPNGHKYSFLMSDPMARDAINDAFNILWDEGKINPQEAA